MNWLAFLELFCYLMWLKADFFCATTIVMYRELELGWLFSPVVNCDVIKSNDTETVHRTLLFC